MPLARTGGLSAAILLLAACGAAQSGPTHSVDVSGSEARALVEGGAVLLDVTPPSRAAESIIEGRTHIPLSELEARLGELPRDRTIVVYCLGGGGSPRAAELLRARGFDVRLLGARRRWGASP